MATGEILLRNKETDMKEKFFRWFFHPPDFTRHPLATFMGLGITFVANGLLLSLIPVLFGLKPGMDDLGKNNALILSKQPSWLIAVVAMVIIAVNILLTFMGLRINKKLYGKSIPYSEAVGDFIETTIYRVYPVYGGYEDVAEVRETSTVSEKAASYMILVAGVVCFFMFPFTGEKGVVDNLGILAKIFGRVAVLSWTVMAYVYFRLTVIAMLRGGFVVLVLAFGVAMVASLFK